MKHGFSRAPFTGAALSLELLGFGLLGLGLLGAGTACTPLDDPEDVYDDTNVTAEVEQQLPAAQDGPIDESRPSAGSPWACIDGARASVPAPEDRPETVNYTVSIVDWVTNDSPPDLTITVCNRIDALCAEPFAVITPPADRQITFALPARFEVYLILQATDHVPATYYFDGPVVQDRVGGLIQLLRFPTVAGLAQQFLSTQLDPTMGVLSMRSYDCNGAITPGATFEIDPSMGVPYTLINGAPTRSIVPTDASGIAGFANVPEGSFLVRGFVADDNREFGLANFNVKPGQFSLVEVRSTN